MRYIKCVYVCVSVHTANKAECATDVWFLMNIVIIRLKTTHDTQTFITRPSHIMGPGNNAASQTESDMNVKLITANQNRGYRACIVSMFDIV